MGGIGLGAVTVAASLVAGLLGPVAIAVYAVVLSVPVWIAWYWLARRGCTQPEAGRLRSEPVAVRSQPGRFASASRVRIPSISVSNPGASSATMAAARMAS